MVWKKALCCVIMMLLLTGCGGSNTPSQQALDLRTAILENGGCAFTADITVDFSDRVYQYTVECSYTAGGSCRITVVHPEEIAGITAIVSDDGAVVEFDGVALDFGTLANGNISAMEAAWLMGACWDSAYISSVGKDGDFLRVTYLDGYDDGQLTVDTWLDEKGVPFRGEIAHDGMRCLTLQISQFQLNI